MLNLMPWRKQQERPIARLRDEIEELVERFLSRWPAPFDTEYGLDRLWGLDVENHDDEGVVRADLPGFEPNEIDVHLSGRRLTIKAEHKQESNKTGNGHALDQRHRSFQRTLMLPNGIDTDRIEARYHNGVLEIRMPKREEAKPKHISVRT